MKKLLASILLVPLIAFHCLARAQDDNLKASGGNISFDWSTVVDPQVIGSYTYYINEYEEPDVVECYGTKTATDSNDYYAAGNHITYSSNSSGGNTGCYANIYQIIITVTSGTAKGKKITLSDNTVINNYPQPNGCTGTIVYKANSQTLSFNPAYSTCIATIE